MYLHVNSICKQTREDGGEIGGNRVHLHSQPVKHLDDLRNREKSQCYSSIHEDWRPKIEEDTEKSDGETIKPGAVKRPELDLNRGHPNNRDSETTFTLLFQRTCKVGAVNTRIPAGRGNPPTKEPPADNNGRRQMREWKPH